MTSRDDDLDQLLTTLRLPRIRAVIDQELARAEKTQPSYRELVARLLREEVHALREQRTASRVRRAKLPEAWTLETFPFERQPGVSAAAVKQLAELSFMERRQNLVLIGPTGVGKTGIAMSLLRKAVRRWCETDETDETDERRVRVGDLSRSQPRVALERLRDEPSVGRRPRAESRPTTLRTMIGVPVKLRDDGARSPCPCTARARRAATEPPHPDGPTPVSVKTSEDDGQVSLFT